MKPLLLTLLFALFATHASFAQWVQVGLANRAVKDIAARNSTLFAVTDDSGSVLRSTDNGAHWTVVVDSGAVDVAIAPSGFVFVVMNDSLYRSSDNGGSWLHLNVEQILSSKPMNVSTSPTGVGFCGIICEARVTRTLIAKSTDGGLTWSSPGFETFGGISFAFRGYSVITAGGFYGPGTDGAVIQLSFDDGQTWLPRLPPPLLIDESVIGLCSNGNVLFGGYYPDKQGLYLSIDSCWSWTRVSTIIPKCGVSIEAGGMLVGADGSGVFLFSDNGDSLGTRNAGLTNLSVHTLTMDNNGYAYAGTDNGVWRRPLSEIVTSVEETQTALPPTFSLAQNYPNPFNPSTTISYQLPTQSRVTLKVFDMLGREVATLVNEVKSPGTYTVQWDGSGVASGVYLYRLQAGSFGDVKKVILLK